MVELCQKHFGTLPTIQHTEGPNGQGGMLAFFHLFWAQFTCNFVTFGEHFEVKMLPWAQLEAQGGTSGTQVATRVPQSSKK